ncbi:MAG TPA: RsmE family RNA methyltransferase [Chthonomonadales bacterium]|nr:RsmE family RNA methyltransferase [Chthonomonadales bacterium]
MCVDSASGEGRFLFVEPDRFDGAGTVTIDGEDHHHLCHVLRVRPGQPLVLLDGRGSAFCAHVSAVSRASLTARIHGPAACPPEPAVAITVAQAIGRGGRFEEALEHATEAGASAFVPLACARAVVRLTDHEAERKGARWRMVVKGAAEQARRSRPPHVAPAAGIEAVARSGSTYALALAADPRGEPIAAVLPPEPPPTAIVVVGPEGGLAAEEIDALVEAGFRVVSLGPFVLRTETAAVIAVCQMLFRYAGATGDKTGSR